MCPLKMNINYNQFLLIELFRDKTMEGVLYTRHRKILSIGYQRLGRAKLCHYLRVRIH